jgi:hypothetical protein
MQWVFDRGAMTNGAASHLSLVSSGAAAIVGQGNDALVVLALRELRDALPAARAAAVRRASVVRERRATFSLPAVHNNTAGRVLPRRRLDRHGIARYD